LNEEVAAHNENEDKINMRYDEEAEAVAEEVEEEKVAPENRDMNVSPSASPSALLVESGTFSPSSIPISRPSASPSASRNATPVESATSSPSSIPTSSPIEGSVECPDLPTKSECNNEEGCI